MNCSLWFEPGCTQHLQFNCLPFDCDKGKKKEWVGKKVEKKKEKLKKIVSNHKGLRIIYT